MGGGGRGKREMRNAELRGEGRPELQFRSMGAGVMFNKPEVPFRSVCKCGLSKLLRAVAPRQEGVLGGWI